MQRAPPATQPIEIWPLRLIDFDDEEQFKVIYSLLRRYVILLYDLIISFNMLYSLPHVVFFYLDQYVFPEVLKHQSLKLSACGQELGIARLSAELLI